VVVCATDINERAVLSGGSCSAESQRFSTDTDAALQLQGRAAGNCCTGRSRAERGRILNIQNPSADRCRSGVSVGPGERPGSSATLGKSTAGCSDNRSEAAATCAG